jgi:hypothetical protein
VKLPNWLYSFRLWQMRLSDMPELRGLDPKDAWMKVAEAYALAKQPPPTRNRHINS